MENSRGIKNKKILIVDDEEDVRNFLRAFFQQKGFETVLAESGERAIQLLREQTPGVILLDLKMPGMSGFETLKKIREFNPEIGVVLATGIKDEDLVREATALGTYSYVAKPFDLKYLELVVMTRLVMNA